MKKLILPLVAVSMALFSVAPSFAEDADAQNIKFTKKEMYGAKLEGKMVEVSVMTMKDGKVMAMIPFAELQKLINVQLEKMGN